MPITFHSPSPKPLSFSKGLKVKPKTPHSTGLGAGRGEGGAIFLVFLAGWDVGMHALSPTVARKPTLIPSVGMPPCVITICLCISVLQVHERMRVSSLPKSNILYPRSLISRPDINLPPPRPPRFHRPPGTTLPPSVFHLDRDA